MHNTHTAENQLRAIRLANKWTQAQLADEAGLPQLVISVLEDLTPTDFAQLAQALSQGPAYLVAEMFGPRIHDATWTGVDYVEPLPTEAVRC